MLFQVRGNIRDFAFREAEYRIILKIDFGTKPYLVQHFTPVSARQVFPDLPSEYILQREVIGFKVEGNLGPPLFYVIEPKMIINDATFKVNIGTIDHPREIAESQQRIVDH